MMKTRPDGWVLEPRRQERQSIRERRGREARARVVQGRSVMSRAKLGCPTLF